jgi:spore coat polysaccharide biosynthesis protein SpsF
MILAILQARLSSTRLPGKVLKPILGRPMLEMHLERLARSTMIDKLIVATSDRPDDTPIAELCEKLDVACFRGSLGDVLDRYYRAAERLNPEIVVRLTGDCPLADPEIIDAGIDYFLKNNFDYVSNCVQRTFPIGLDFEVFRFVCLETAWREATLPSEREHVTPFIKNRPERFAIGHYTNPVNLSRHRWTVDEPDDFAFVAAVYEALFPNNPRFTIDDILALLGERPELMQLNYHIEHGEGYRKSLREDKAFLAARRQ